MMMESVRLRESCELGVKIVNKWLCTSRALADDYNQCGDGVIWLAGAQRSKDFCKSREEMGEGK